MENIHKIVNIFQSCGDFAGVPGGTAADTLFLGGNIKVLDIEKLTESNAEVLAKNIN